MDSFKEADLKNHVLFLLSRFINKYNFEHEGYELDVIGEVSVKEVEKSSKFLPRNFKFVSTGNADVVVFLSHINEAVGYCPVIVGEVKRKLVDPQKVFNQLFIYQLACQRPYLWDSNSSRLLGFLMDFTDGYIIELSCGLWTDKKLVKCQKVERYKTETVKQRIDFFGTIIDRLAKALKTVKLNELTKPQSPTFRFPSVGSLLDNCTHILKLSATEFKSVIFPIISSFGQDVEFVLRSVTSLEGLKASLEGLEADKQLLFKVCGSTISGGFSRITLHSF